MGKYTNNNQLFKPYPKKRILFVFIITIIVVVGTSLLPTKVDRAEQSGLPNIKGCRCDTLYYGFPLHFALTQKDQYHRINFVAPARAQVNVNPGLSQCFPGCFDYDRAAKPWVVGINAILIFFTILMYDVIGQRIGYARGLLPLIPCLIVLGFLYLYSSSIIDLQFPPRL